MIDFWIKFVLVAVSLAVVDACWAYYLLAVERREAIKAGIWGAAIVAVGAYATVQYVHDARMVAAAVIGGFVGTYAVVKRAK